MISTRSIFVQLAALAITAGVCLAQTPAKLQFEVASIKPSATPPAFKYEISDHRIDMGGMTLKSLVVIAFGMQDWQVTVPDWATTTRVDIQATLPPGATRAQVPQLLQTLLADRLGLVFHHESQEQRVYAIVQSKTGAKLAEAAVDNTDRTFLTGRSTMYKVDSDEADGSYTISAKDGNLVLDAERITMSKLAGLLTSFRYFDDPVVDLTGLNGYWQVRLDVPRVPSRRPRQVAPPATPAATAEDPDGVSLQGSLRKLGLDLEHRKASVDHIVVDHIEKQPTEN